MDESALYTVTTKMEKEDYRRFLYFTTFQKTPAVIFGVAFLSAACAAIVTLMNEGVSFPMFLLLWAFAAALLFGCVCFKMEHMCRQRVDTDKTGMFKVYQTFTFYNDHLIVENEKMENGGMESVNKTRYDECYRIFETKDCFILYFNAKMVSVINKKNIDSGQLFEIKKFLEEKFAERYKRI